MNYIWNQKRDTLSPPSEFVLSLYFNTSFGLSELCQLSDSSIECKSYFLFLQTLSFIIEEAT